MRALKLLARLFVGLFAAVLLLYLIAVLVNWRDRPPSADVLRLQRVLVARPPVANADNGFVYVLGMNAPRNADPQDVGEQRFRWLESMNSDPGRRDPDPITDQIEFSDRQAPTIKAVASSCGFANQDGCADAFSAAPPPDEWSETDRMLLDRYRTLLTRTAWREIVPVDVLAPIPAYQHPLSGQRLYLLALREADAAALRERLDADLAHWRRMLANADILVTRMIAVAGLRQHFQFGNLLLRRMPPAEQAKAIPYGWRTALTPAELSIERTAAGEHEFSRSAFRVFSDPSSPDPQLGEMSEKYRPARRIAIWLMRPFYQPQDTVNTVARLYVESVDAFAVPIDQYAAAERKLRARPIDHPFGSRVYDASGDLLRGLGNADLAQYAMRTANAEAWRRAALLAAELRASGVDEALVPGELRKTPLVNPFDLAPFRWNGSRRTIEAVGAGKTDWREQHFAY